MSKAIEEAEKILLGHHVKSIKEYDTALENLIKQLKLAEKVVEATKKLYAFNNSLYLKDRENGNYAGRSLDTMILLESLSQHEELK